MAARRSSARRRSAARRASRLARHLFTLATTRRAGKEVRVTGIGERLAGERRAAWERWYGPVAAARWGSAWWHAARLGGLRRAATSARSCSSPRDSRASAGDVLLVLAAGARLSAYIGATVGEIGFLRGFWMDGSRRLAWLEDYAASLPRRRRICRRPRSCATASASITCRSPIPARRGSCSTMCRSTLPAGAVVAIVGENGAGKTTLVKLLAKMYEPSSGAIFVDDTPLARIAGRRVARPPRRRVSGFFPLRIPRRGRRSASAMSPRLDDEAGGQLTAVDRAGAADVVARLRLGTRDAARADVAGRRRTVVRTMAEARAGARLHARPAAAADTRRADRGARRRDRARAVRALRRGCARERSATGASRCWSRTASRPSAWPT